MDEPRTVRLDSVASTQEAARSLPIGSVVVADHQSAGRGRLDRRWEAPPGTALLASFVLRRNPILSLAAGVAVAEACGGDARLKWPNDLMVEGRKAGGILVEVAESKAIVGIGINLTAAPPGAAVIDQGRDELLEKLRERLAVWSEAESPDVLRRWRELSDTLGRHVRVELPGRTLEGVAEDIDEEGALVVGDEHVRSGDVIHLRS
jgi:BirA family transcriptional regulator, biotin operon repressor / biotin---[acetyl-CoA-carboxylase] ligase